MAQIISEEKKYEKIGEEFIEAYDSLPGGTNKKVTTLLFENLLDKVGLTSDIRFGAVLVPQSDGTYKAIFFNLIKDVRKAYEKRSDPKTWSAFDKQYNEIIARMEWVNKGARRSLFPNTFSILNASIYLDGNPKNDSVLNSKLENVLLLDQEELVSEKESWSIAQKSLFFGGALAIGGAIYYFKK
jgi:hypothetical protein